MIQVVGLQTTAGPQNVDNLQQIRSSLDNSRLTVHVVQQLRVQLLVRDMRPHKLYVALLLVYCFSTTKLNSFEFFVCRAISRN